MKFLLKSRDISEDNEFALLQARRWWAWKNPSVEFEIRYADDEYPGVNAGFSYCPVGSLEFCLGNLPGKPRPLNVPDRLAAFAGRIVMTETDMMLALAKNDNRSVYVKSGDTFKHRSNGFYGAADFIRRKEELFGDDAVQASTDLNRVRTAGSDGTFYGKQDLVSEWRCFVYGGNLVGCHNYSGLVFSPPNEDTVGKMISAYGPDAPPAYTLDVGVCATECSERTVVLETHDFFGCGMYGFDRPDVYPYMCYRWFLWWKGKCGRA